MRALVRPLLVLVVLVVLGPRAHAQGDARAQAKAAFARATAAEERKDWQTAIREYLAAYDLAPHPDVLYNVASVYERLEDLRSAATYYRRYLDESDAPADRARVERLIETLRKRASVISVRTTPAGATIVVDGERRGRAPLDVRVPGGHHEILAELDGASASQVVTVEYAEPATVALTLGGEGRLVVSSNEAGATVEIDGEVVGVTPWSGGVRPGRRAIVVRKEGFATVERSVEIPPSGTAQITAGMVRPLGYIEPTQPSNLPSYLLGSGGGMLFTREERVAFEVIFGYRPASRRWDAWTGLAFSEGGLGYALGARLFVLTGVVRPYAGVGLDLVAQASHARAVGGLMAADLGGGRSQVDIFIEGGLASALTSTDAEAERAAVVFAGVTWHLSRTAAR